MSTIGQRNPASFRRARDPDIVSRLIFVTTLPAFLVVATARRALPRRWRPTSPGAPKSILAEAVASARTCMVFASMG
jgi:hypothetical protein